MTEDYHDYLKDESRKIGKATSISFPQSEEEIINTIELLSGSNEKITIQGARTGITAGAVPNGGHIINIEKMNKITGLRYDNDKFILSVQPGVRLINLRKAISKKNFDTSQWSRESIEALEKMKKAGDFFFPPDPTETTASIGGMVACNASGARSFYYGPTRKYVQSLSIILSDGSKLRITRNNQKAEGYSFILKTDTGRIIKGEVPKYEMPRVKNASGYYVHKDMDLIDLFIGSEGTLGIITEIEIVLLKRPRYTWGGLFFFNNEDGAIDFVNCLKSDIFHFAASQKKDYMEIIRPLIDDENIKHTCKKGYVKIKPVAIEYFDSNALELLRRQKRDNKSFSKIPDIKPEYNTSIYVEFDGDSEEDVEDSMIEAARRAQLCYGKEEDNWVAHSPQLIEQMKFFRYAVPEAVNSIIDKRRKKDPGITKLGTDMAVTDDKLREVIEMYRSDLEENGFEYVMFGHIGNNHIHVNILPKSMEEYTRGKELYKKWAQKISREGGTVSAEHGIGKLKNDFLELMYGQTGIKDMVKIKKTLEPKLILNQGNLFNIEYMK